MRTIAICIACLSLILVAAQEDFAEIRDGYEFIYHKTHDLLLSIHDNKCYFALVKEDSSHPWSLKDHKQEVEDYVMSLIEKHRDIPLASLDAARDEFNDLLADFHCTNKDVYITELDLTTAVDENGNPFSQFGGKLLGGAAAASVIVGQSVFQFFNPLSWPWIG